MSKFLGEIPNLGLDNFPDFEPAVKDRFEKAHRVYDEICFRLGIGLVFKETTAMAPQERFIEHAAMLQFIGSLNLLDAYFEKPGYPVYSNPKRKDKSDLDIWVVKLTPQSSSIQVVHKHTPGKNNQGWADTLAIHRREYASDGGVLDHSILEIPDI